MSCSSTSKSSPDHFVPLLDFVCDPGTSTSLWKKRKSNEPQTQLSSKKPKMIAKLPLSAAKGYNINDKPKTSSKVLKTEEDAPKTELQNCDPYDVARFYEQLNAFDSNKKFVHITNVWTPPQNFKFPKDCGDKGRSFQSKWLKERPWLAYSEKLDAAFCLHCISFEIRGGKNVNKTSYLVKVPFRNWKKAKEQFKHHEEKSNYHAMASEQFQAFNKLMNQKSMGINLQLNAILQENITRNREVLADLVKIVLCLARQNIPMRGHRDDDISLCLHGNPGNFKAILDLAIDLGCSRLTEHMRNAPRNATYRSKTVQDEVLELCGKEVTRKIIIEVKTARQFSILADETSDISKKEQMPLVLRYVGQQERAKERLIKVVDVDKGLDGKSISKKITDEIDQLGLDMGNARGQGYDGGGKSSHYFGE